MKPKASLRSFLALAGSSLLLASHVHAQGPYYWDNNGDTAGFGTASGTWSATASLFSNSATGVVTPTGSTIPTSSDDVYFGANTLGNALGSGSITVDGAVVANSIYYEAVTSGTLTFNTINGGKITTGNSRVQHNETGSTLTFNADFVGATTQFFGAGSTTVFNGNYKNTGATTVRAGHTLHFGSTATLDITNKAITFLSAEANGTIRYSSNNDGAIIGSINGTSTTNKVIKDGSATSTLTLGGTNGFAGQYRIEAGTLKFDIRNALYSGTDTSWLASNIIVGNTGVLGLRVGGTNRFTIADVGTLLTNLGGANGTSTTGFAAGSAIAIDTASAGGDQTLTALVANSTGTGGGSFGLTKLGANTLILDNANTYTGATKVNGGTLRAGVSSGGQAFGVGSAVTMANVAGATLDLNGTNQTIGSLAGGGATGGNVTLGANATLTTGGNNNSTIYAGVISGTGTSGLTKTGDGTFTLTGASTYFGNTTVNDGVLDVSGVGARIYSGIVTPTGVVTVNTGGTLVVSGFAKGGTNSLGDLDTPASNLVINGGTLRINDTNTVGRAVTIGANGGTIEVNTTGYVMNYNAVLPNVYTDNSTMTLTGTGSATMGKAITGSGVSLVKNGSGTWTLNPGATSNHTGTTTVNGGTLNITGSTSAGSAVTVGGSAASGSPKLAGSGTINGAVTLESAGGGAVGILNAGDSTLVNKVGTLAMGSSLEFKSGSIFEWDLGASSTSNPGTDFDSVSVTGNIDVASGSIFKVVFSSTVLNDITTNAPFWSTDGPKTWNMSAIFGEAFNSGAFTSVQTSTDVAAYGSFSISGTALTWVPIPEPTSALAGLLLTAGLLRRRRK